MKPQTIDNLGLQGLTQEEVTSINGGAPSPTTSPGYDLGYMVGSAIEAVRDGIEKVMSWF